MVEDLVEVGLKSKYTELLKLNLRKMKAALLGRVSVYRCSFILNVDNPCWSLELLNILKQI